MNISPIGNDVVDLRDRETRPGAIHPRFDFRVFAPEERARLGDGPAPERLRWSLWAAKESAFKAARKLHPELGFHPRLFAVRLLEDARGRFDHAREGLDEAREEGLQDMRETFENVRSGLESARTGLESARAELESVRAEVVHRWAGRFTVWLEGARDWVHAVAAPAADVMSRPQSLVAFLDELDLSDAAAPGEAVRELASRAVASMMSFDPDVVRVVTDEAGIPRLLVRGRPVPIDLSLSHHGRLVACSWRGAE